MEAVYEKTTEFYDKFARLGTKITDRAEHHYNTASFDYDMWNEIAKEGLWKIPVPIEYGGYGQTWKEFSKAMESLSYNCRDLGLLLSMIAHIGCVRVIMLHGTEEQKNYFLPKLMNGSIGATAITEESGGSDVARIQASGVPGKKENSYILSGRKAHITNGPVADLMVVVGRIPSLGKRDITLFILEDEMDGISKGEQENMLGNHTSPTGDIILEDFEVSEFNLLGPKGNGLSILYNMISLDRMMYGLIAASFSEPILESCLKHANEREAFKKKIAEHQYVQKRLTDIKINIELSRSISYSALDKLIEDAEDASMMCSMAKLVGTTALHDIAMDYMQIHGHKGYMKGYITQVLQDTTGTLIAGGTTDIQRINIFQQLQRVYGYEQ